MANQVIELTVTLASASLGEGALSQPCLEITSNGGMESLTVRAEVTWQPALSLEPKRRLAIGDVTPDQLQPITAPLLIRNTGGGVLQGRLATDQPWLTFDAATFNVPSGGSVAIQVTANVTDPTFQISSGVIRVESGGEVQEVVATVGVRRDWYDAQTRRRGLIDVGAAPGVVEQVRTLVGHGLTDLVAPGVHADDDAGGAGPHRRDEARHPAQLLGHLDGLARAGLDPAHVDDVGALGHGPVDRVQRGGLGVGGAPVEEGVRGAVDDRHDERRLVGPAAGAQPKRHGGPPDDGPGSRGASTRTWACAWHDRGRTAGAAPAGDPRGGALPVTVLFALTGIAVVVAVAMLAVGRLGELAPTTADRAPLEVPEGALAADDVDAVRFAVGLRGYRMDEVDEVLDRVAVDLAARDERIAELEAQLARPAALADPAAFAPEPAVPGADDEPEPPVLPPVDPPVPPAQP